MPIVSGDIRYNLSGGAANSDPDAALGGAISTTEIVDATLHNLFDVVTGAESAAGMTDYRCFYVKNNHGSLVLQNAEVFIDTQTPSTDTVAGIGLGTSAVGGVEQTIADELTAPAGVTFTELTGQPNSLAIGDIPAGSHKAVWVRRVVSAGASAFALDSVVVRAGGETDA